MSDRIKKILRVKLWLAIVGLALFGFVSLFSAKVPAAHSQGYVCDISPWWISAYSSVSVTNLSNNQTVTSTANGVYFQMNTASITINSGDSIRITFDGYTSGGDYMTSYNGYTTYNNSSGYYYAPTTITTGPITVGGMQEFAVSECQSQADASVTVNVVTPAPTASISAASTSVAYNTGTNITWSSTNATRCEVKKNGTLVSGWTATSGTQATGNLTASATYAVTCYNSANTASNTASVTVTVPSADISVSCTPSLVSIAPGSSGSFSLTSTSLNGFTGPVTWSTASTVPTGASLSYTNNGASLISGGNATTTATISTALTTPAGTYNFIFTTTSSVSSKTCATVQLTVLPRPTATISAVSTSIVYNGSTSITWSSTNATSCTVTPNNWTGTSGTQPTGNLTTTTTYTVTCTGTGGTNSSSVTVTVGPAPTATISATSTSIVYGGSTSITWSSTNATSCTVTPNNWTGLSGTQSTGALTTTTTYTATCTNSANASGSASVTVTVGAAPTATISATSTSIVYGGSTSITWSSTNATSCNVTPNNWTGLSGTQSTGALTVNTTYTATCTNSANSSASSSVTVTVGAAPTATISATSTSIAYGASTSITWSSTNATSCTVTPNNWTGLSGTQSTGALTANTTYTTTCSNSAGSQATASVTVTVAGGPTATISATSTSITYGASTSITWSSTNATSCTVTPNNWTGLSGTQSTGTLTSNTTYTVTCSNAAGSQATASVTVTVGPAPTVTISATSTSILYGASTSITWSSTNATSCTVTPNNWTGLSGTQSTGALTSSKTYTATCTNSANASINASVTVTVGPAPTATISATSTSIVYGGSTSITWSSTNASSCNVTPNNWTGISGTQSTGALTATTTYTATCSNTAGGTGAPASVTVTVGAAPTATISATSTSIAYGGSTTITWSSTNATSCTVTPNNWTGLSGTQSTGALTSTTTYTVTCSNSAGRQATASVTVTLPTPSITVSCSPATITITQGSTASYALQATSQNGFSGAVTWSLSGSAPTNTTVSYNNNGASLTVGGNATTTGIFQTQYTTPTGTYNLTFNTSSTAATQSCGVQLIVAGAAPVITLTANGSSGSVTVNYYDYVTIAWSAVNASTCSISPTGWTGTSGSQSVGPVTGNLSYTATCTSPAGINATASVSVSVNNPNISNATVDTIGYTLSTDQKTLTTSASGKRPCYSPCTRDSYFDVTINGEVQKVTDAGTTITQWSGSIYYPQITSLSNWSWPARTQDTGAVSTPNPVTPMDISSWPNGNYRFCATVSGSTTAVYPDVSTTYSKCTTVFTINNRDFTLTCSLAVLNLSTTTTQGSVGLTTSANTGFTNTVLFTNTISPSTGTLPTISYTNNGQVPNATTTALITITSSTTPATYTITFTGTGGGVSKSCNVQLNLIPSASISASLTNNKYVPYNGSFSATWTSTFATSCTVSPYGWTGTAGTQTATNVTSDVTVTVTCTGPGGTATASVLAPVGPSGDIKCDGSDGPCTVAYGGSSTLTWTSSSVTSSCYVLRRTTQIAIGTSGSVNTQTSGPISSATTFDLYCSRSPYAADIKVDSVVVTVPDPSITLSCTPTTISIDQGGSTSFALQATSNNGYGGTVTWSTASTLPSPNTVTYTNNSPSLTVGSSATTTFTIQTQLATTPGTYSITFTATPQSPTIVKTCNIQLIINPVKPQVPKVAVTKRPCETLGFSWNAPASGPRPTSYSLYRAGKALPIYTTNANANDTYSYSYGVSPSDGGVLMYFVLVTYNYNVSSGNEGIYDISWAPDKCEAKLDFSEKEIISAQRKNSPNKESNTNLVEGDGISNPFAFSDGGRFRVDDKLTFKVIIKNNGTQTLNSLSVRDVAKYVSFPTDLTKFIFSNKTVDGVTSPCGLVSLDKDTIVASIASLDENEVCSITYDAVVLDPTKTGTRPYYFQNTAQITVGSPSKYFEAKTPVYSIDVDTGSPTRTEVAP